MQQVIQAFRLPPGTPTPLAGGRIHTTVRYEWDGGSVILQRLHPTAFPDPHALMHTLCAVTQTLSRAGIPTVHFLPCTGGGFLFPHDGGLWRAMEDLGAHPSPRTLPELSAAGRAVACFENALSGLPLPGPAVPHFHDTARYFDVLAALCRSPLPADARRLADALLPLRDQACALQSLPRRVIHGDPKAANILLCPEPVLIDLDTVMPAPAAYDLGDAVRSMCVQDNAPDIARCRALIGGYLAAAAFLTPPERAALPLAPFCVTAELSVRYLTDALQNGRYFGISPHEALHRCADCLQLALAFRDTLPQVQPIF